jgi:hypothetical protein
MHKKEAGKTISRCTRRRQGKRYQDAQEGGKMHTHCNNNHKEGGRGENAGDTSTKLEQVGNYISPPNRSLALKK